MNPPHFFLHRFTSAETPLGLCQKELLARTGHEDELNARRLRGGRPARGSFFNTCGLCGSLAAMIIKSEPVANLYF